jgi:hypothetical protein
VISGLGREVAENCATNSGYFYRRFGKSYQSHPQGSESKKHLTLRMVPIPCPETSVINYHYSLRNNPKGCSFPIEELNAPIWILDFSFQFLLAISYYFLPLELWMRKNPCCLAE